MSIFILLLCLAPISVAEQSGTATLAQNTFLNLETGTVSTRGGDLLWNGSALIPWGGAGVYNVGKAGARAYKSIALRHATVVAYGPAPVSATALVTGDIFGVRTSSGHYVKAMVIAAG